MAQNQPSNLVRVVDSTFDRIQARNGLVAKNQSQMTKLLPVLQLAGKKDPPPELVQARLEKRVKDLTDVLERLSLTKTRMKNLATVDTVKKMKKLTAGLKRINEVREARVPQGTNKILIAVVNELTSIREGVFLKSEMSDEDYSTPVLEKSVTQIGSLLDQAKASLEAHKAQSSGVDLEAEAETRMYADFSDLLALANKEAKESALQDLKTKPWAVIRAPVIPMPKKGILDPQRFKAAGFKCESMAGYPMFRSQLVIGINRSMLDLTEKEKEKGISISRERVFKAATKVKRLVEKQTGQKLHFVDERPHGAQGGAWFWLMPEHEINVFASCCPGGQIQLLNFGFAFNS